MLPARSTPADRSAPSAVITQHRWSADLAARLDTWAATAPTMVMLPGGRAMVGHDVGASFSEHVLSAWSASHRAGRRSHAVTHPSSCTVFQFDARVVAPVLPLGARAPLLVQVGPAPFFRFLWRTRMLATGSLAEAWHAGEDAVALLRHVLFRAWPCGHSSLNAPTPRRARHRSLAFEAQAIMSVSLACRHPLEELARTLNTSPFHLAHVFRSEIGISLHQYLVHLRLVAALERLHAGEPDLSKLALDLGFSHHSHFSSLFRRATGHSPRDARRMLSPDSCATSSIGAQA